MVEVRMRKDDDAELQIFLLQRREDRRSQVGTGDRSEKIRTYNFPQSRITDHRIKLSVSDVNGVLAGSLDQLIDPVVAYVQAEALRGETTVQ